MRYWLIAIPRQDLNRCLELGVFGRSSKNKFLGVEPGDKLAFYVTGEYTIAALGWVTEGYFFDSSDIFHRQGDFPHRIRFAAKQLIEPIEFKPLVTKFRFIRKPEYWPAYIRRGFAELFEEDWALIAEIGSKKESTKL